MRKVDNVTAWGRDSYVLMDAAEIAPFVKENEHGYRHYMTSTSWMGGTFDKFLRCVVTGDDTLVDESEKFLAKLEDQVPMSRGWRNLDDVVGAVPNVPAFLAGHPQCMRRRERTMRDTAPLAIYMDLTSSGGISASDIERRGVTLLALTRLLVEHRPVELWVGTSIGDYTCSSTAAWRIDTTPMDLARAAYHISATSMSRGFGYRVCEKEMTNTWRGKWPFNNYGLHVSTAPKRLESVFPGQEMLYVPPIHLSDEMTQNPVGWIKRTLAKYVNGEEQ